MGLLTDIANSLSILATGMVSKPIIKLERGGSPSLASAKKHKELLDALIIDIKNPRSDTAQESFIEAELMVKDLGTIDSKASSEYLVKIREALREQDEARYSSPPPKEKIDSTLEAYIEAALWSTNDEDEEPLDSNYGSDDISKETLDSMRRDVTNFIKENIELINESGQDDGQIGHDFWLTRNGHGVGFWDRGLGEVGDRLTEATKEFGEYNLYAGDDGKIYSDYAKGGSIKKSMEENEALIKELRNLQRELNSHRLLTYTKGDTSEEEMARQRERESKSARFDEVLRILNKTEGKPKKLGKILGWKYLNSRATSVRTFGYGMPKDKKDKYGSIGGDKYFMLPDKQGDEDVYRKVKGKENDYEYIGKESSFNDTSLDSDIKRMHYAKGGDISSWEDTALKELTIEYPDDELEISSTDTDMIKVEGDDGSEYNIYDNYANAEYAATQFVREMIEHEPELFDQDWLAEFVYADIGILADEEADFRVEEMDDDEIISEAGISGEIEDLDERMEIADYNEEVDEYTSLESERETAIENVKKELRDDIYNEWNEGLSEDPINFLVNEKGIYSNTTDVLNAGIVHVNYQEAAEDAIKTDGVAHFFAGYDHEQIDLPSGAVAFRTN